MGGFKLRPNYWYQKVGIVIREDRKRKQRTALVEFFRFAPRYQAFYKRSRKFHFHDEYQLAKTGDIVPIAPCRPDTVKAAGGHRVSYRLVEVMRANTAPVRV